jgi:hypothetical protein
VQHTYKIKKTVEEIITEDQFIELLVEKATPLIPKEEVRDYKVKDIVRLSNQAVAMVARVGKTTTTCLGMGEDQRITQFNVGGEHGDEVSIVSVIKAA